MWRGFSYAIWVSIYADFLCWVCWVYVAFGFMSFGLMLPSALCCSWPYVVRVNVVWVNIVRVNVVQVNVVRINMTGESPCKDAVT